MDEAKEYLTTERMGAYYPEKAVVKKSENGVTRALYRDSCYTIDDVNYTRERIMIIKGKRFICILLLMQGKPIRYTKHIKSTRRSPAERSKKLNNVYFLFISASINSSILSVAVKVLSTGNTEEIINRLPLIIIMRSRV